MMNPITSALSLGAALAGALLVSACSRSFCRAVGDRARGKPMSDGLRLGWLVASAVGIGCGGLLLLAGGHGLLGVGRALLKNLGG